MHDFAFFMWIGISVLNNWDFLYNFSLYKQINVKILVRIFNQFLCLICKDEKKYDGCSLNSFLSLCGKKTTDYRIYEKTQIRS